MGVSKLAGKKVRRAPNAEETAGGFFTAKHRVLGVDGQFWFKSIESKKAFVVHLLLCSRKFRVPGLLKAALKTPITLQWSHQYFIIQLSLSPSKDTRDVEA